MTASMCAAGPAVAQSTAAPNAAENPPEGLQEIVVTAEKRSEDLERTPIAIVAFTGDALKSQGVMSLLDIGELAPSLHIVDIGSGTQIFINGVGSSNFAPTADPSVSLNLDGNYLSSNTLPNTTMYDVQQVEVLKGPQGTLYGRNASAGAVNIQTNKPVDHTDASVSLTGGNFGTNQESAMLNLPVSDDFWLRFAMQHVKHDGYQSDGYDDAEDFGARIRALYKPTDAVSILLTGDYASSTGSGPGDVGLPYADSDHPWNGTEKSGYSVIHGWGTYGELDWDLGSATFTLQPAYRYNANENDSYTLTTSAAPYYTADKEFSVEARITSNDASPLKWIVGLYYLNDINTANFSFVAGVFPIAGVATTLTAGQNLNSIAANSDAAFGQATYSLTDSLRLTAGLRYTEDRKSEDGYLFTHLSNSLFTSQTDYSIPGAAKFNHVNWKGGLEYDLAAHSLLYANVSTGYKSGGLNQELPGAPSPFPPFTYAPETLTAYELGNKNRLLDNTLELNLDLFYWVYNDQQIGNFGVLYAGPDVSVAKSPIGVHNINAGKETIYGVEVAPTYLLTPADRLRAIVDYRHSENNTFPDEPSLVGRVLPHSPTWSGTLGYQHVWKLADGGAVTGGIDTALQTESYTSYLLSPLTRQPGFMKTNAMVSYSSSSSRYTVTAFVHNLENRAVIANAQPSVTGLAPYFLGTLEAPRTYGLTLAYKY